VAKAWPQIKSEQNGKENNRPLLQNLTPSSRIKTKNVKQDDDSDVLDGLDKLKISNDSNEKKQDEKSEVEGACGSGAVLPLAQDFIIDSYDLDEYAMPVAVVPLPFCPHLYEISSQENIIEEKVNAHAACEKCDTNNRKENWLCLTCFVGLCSRYVKGHMAEHFDQTQHPMCLSYSDLSVWCYVCESYVHNEQLIHVKELAHKSKFGTESF
jgi:histone deacetylase 6